MYYRCSLCHQRFVLPFGRRTNSLRLRRFVWLILRWWWRRRDNSFERPDKRHHDFSAAFRTRWRLVSCLIIFRFSSVRRVGVVCRVTFYYSGGICCAAGGSNNFGGSSQSMENLTRCDFSFERGCCAALGTGWKLEPTEIIMSYVLLCAVKGS